MRRNVTTTSAGLRPNHPEISASPISPVEAKADDRGRNNAGIPTGPRNPSIAHVYRDAPTTRIHPLNVRTEQQATTASQPQQDGDTAAEAEPAAIKNFNLAIFASTEDDLTQPMNDRPRDRVERVKRMLDSIDRHQRAVWATTKNIVASERQRIVSSEVSSQTSRRDLSISQEEVDEMIEALRAEPEQGTDYNMDTNDMPREAMRDLFEGSQSRQDREDSLRQLQHLVEQSIYYGDEFDADIARVRKKWEDILEKEQKALEEFA